MKKLDYRTKEWDVDFADYLENLRQKKNVILCGDLNVAHEEIDLFNPKGNKRTAGFTPQEREGFSNLLKKGYVDTFRHLHKDLQLFSFWSAKRNGRESNKGWRLDYFVVNEEAMANVVDSEILTDVMGSDHCPIKLRYLI